MGSTCTTVASWFWGLSINWDALAAVGTIAATIVALFLPFRISKREWDRQDQIRRIDGEKAQKDYADVQHEVCSAVDRVLAYHTATMAIFDSEPVYNVGIQAVRRIALNVGILTEMLNLLLSRQNLSDGSLYSAIAAKRIADVIETEVQSVISNWGVADPEWQRRRGYLSGLEQLAAMASKRANDVRLYHGMEPSKTAEKIKNKYVPLAKAIKAARIADSGEPPNTLDEGYF